MRSGILGILLAIQLARAGSAVAGPAEACRHAAAAAERKWALPANLLLAIGWIESGRRDDATGQVQPWPWSANAAGAGYVFASAAEAEAVVGFLRERGIASIDIGCFQVNLHHHPTAFATVAQGFDPDANADYAARFLRELFARSGSWTAAVGAYHSADPALGGFYLAKVLNVWRTLPAQKLYDAPLTQNGDPHVLLLAADAPSVPVYTPETLPPALRLTLARLASPIEAKR